MSKSQVLATLPASSTENDNQIEISLRYNKDGRRGYSLHCQPQHRQNGCVSCVPMHGARMFVEATERFNLNQMNKLVNDYSKPENYQPLLDKVLAMNTDIELKLLTTQEQAA